MEILFVCKWNVGRSQMAEELFNRYSKKNKGVSAGTHAVKYQGKKLEEFADFVIQVLKERDINVSKKIPRQLTSEMCLSADKIVVITGKNDLPRYLVDSKKVINWEIQDGSGKDYEFHLDMRNQIEKLVKELVSEIG